MIIGKKAKTIAMSMAFVFALQGVADLGENTVFGASVDSRDNIVHGRNVEMDSQEERKTSTPDIVTETGGAVVATQEAVVATNSAVDKKEENTNNMPSASPEETDTDPLVSFGKKQYTIPLNWTKTVKLLLKEEAADDLKNCTWVYKSKNKEIAKVNSKGVVTGVSEGETVITVTAKEDASLTASFLAKVQKEKKGWHTTSTGKQYYVTAQGDRKIGYFSVDGNYYYAKSNSYILKEQWKYVKVAGKKYKLYFSKNGKQKQDVSRIIGEQDSYKLEVNISKNMVIVYAKDGDKGYTIPVKAMVCSCGISGHSTITGTYNNLRKVGKWHALYYGTYGKYCTRISGPYLFHSVVYSKYGDNYSLDAKEFAKLGKLASHGCIRLQVKDAKWIYNRSSKCTVKLFRSSKATPLKKPKAGKAKIVSKNKAYDPTDWDVK